MTTELSFLLDLLLNYKLPPKVKTLLSERIKEVEATLVQQMGTQMQPMGTQMQPTVTQMQTGATPPSNLPIVPLEAIAKTQAAAQALQSRQEAIQQSMSGLVEKGRTSPRKF